MMPVFRKVALLLCFSVMVFAQDDPKSNVELPDFVITGKDQIKFPPAKKMKPDIISALSEEFINPPYKAEEFSAGEISTPETIITFKKDTAQVHNGMLAVSFGNISVPELQGSFSLHSAAFSFTPSFSLKNIRDFEPNSGESSYSFDLASSFSTGRGQGIFNNILIDADGGFYSNNRKLYRDTSSFRKRDLNLYSFHAGIRKDFGNNAALFFMGDAAGSSIKEFKSDLTNGSFSLGGFVGFSHFIISADARFSSLALDDFSQNYYHVMPGISYNKPGSAVLSISGGPVKAGSNSGIGLAASGAFNLSEMLGLSLSYQSGWKTSDIFDQLVNSPYYVPDSTNQLFENRLNHLRFETKYSFKHYFEGLVFIKTGKTEKMNYFLRDTSNGVFRAASADVSLMSMGIDLKFHEGPLGFFYGHVEFQSVKDDTDKVLPYISAISANLIYGKTLSSSLSFTAGAEYMDTPFADLQNSRETSSYFDLNLTIAYRLGFFSEGSALTVKANNLLNADNNYWEGYPGRPADVRVGFEMKF